MNNLIGDNAMSKELNFKVMTRKERVKVALLIKLNRWNQS